MLSTWTERLDIRWLRWDSNQAPGPTWDAVDPTGKVQFAYVHGLYRVFDELLARHPNLLIDNCAGGGQRIDFGTLRRAGTMVISDHAEDPHVCRIMQTAGARIFPANYMNSSIYIGPGDSVPLGLLAPAAEDESATEVSPTHRVPGHPKGAEEHVGPFELISRMTGSITLCGHIANWSRRHTRRMCRLLAGYRTFRHLLMKDFHALTEYPRGAEDWDVVQFIDPSTAEAVILAYRVRGNTDRLTVLGADTSGARFGVMPAGPRQF
jgi:hypothetical protein